MDNKCQIIDKNKLLNEPIIYRISIVYLPYIYRVSTVKIP